MLGSVLTPVRDQSSPTKSTRRQLSVWPTPITLPVPSIKTLTSAEYTSLTRAALDSGLPATARLPVSCSRHPCSLMAPTRILRTGQGNVSRLVTLSSVHCELSSGFLMPPQQRSVMRSSGEAVGRAGLRCQDHCLRFPSSCCGEVRRNNL